MLPRAYADWLRHNQPSDASRAALILQLLEVLAGRDARPLPKTLRLFACAEGGPAGGLGLSAEDILSTFELGRADDLVDLRLAQAQVLGEVLDTLYGVESAGRRSGEHSLRRSSGSYFTPRPVARSLVESALGASHLAELVPSRAVRVCDPAMGGGAFLLEAAAGLARSRVESGEAPEVALRSVGAGVYGYDRNALAVAVAQAALWLLTDRSDFDERLACADTLIDIELTVGRDFDWLIGNPPWVAFQGRAAQPLDPERRAWLRRTYSAFAGFATLHGVFAQRATELAPRGLVSLLLPSSLSDLDGYRAARRAVLRTHTLHEPLEEYGQDAFGGVVQPCFGLLASPRTGAPDPLPDRKWRLLERGRHDLELMEPGVPEVLVRLASLPKLPSACFGELGLQSNRRVSTELFLRAGEPKGAFVEPLLEGRNVRAFTVLPPRLFMNPDLGVLRETRCRYRPLADYQRVGFVVRQTAAVTIAAPHNGLRFRNSLLAGYPCGELDVELLVGLLNSALFRAFHASQQRDARQLAFPQVKVAHLRRLPAPPESAVGRHAVRQASALLCRLGPSPEREAGLDQAVFDLFDLGREARDEIRSYLEARRVTKVSRAS